MNNPTPSLPQSSQEDDLPDYDAAPIPAYHPETFNTPKYTYHLRATKTNTWHLAPYGTGTHTSAAPTYEIQYRSTTSIRLFKPRIPDISISYSATNNNAILAHSDFHSNGPLPYCPRARLTVNPNAQAREDTVIEMQAEDWKLWTFNLDGTPYIWTLRDIPACLELSSSLGPDHESDLNATEPLIIARFTYGKVGTKVLAGGEVGTLEIWPDALTERDVGTMVVVAGCATVIKYFDRLGRRYRNDESGGGAAAALIDARAHETTRVKGKFMLF